MFKFNTSDNQYHETSVKKSGTRYERLAAIVFKSLNHEYLVLHDFEIEGESGATHQIDVLLKKEEENEVILIECKDFDISNKPVGLAIVRNFYGVVSDIKPTKAYVVTCCGFTRDAILYGMHNNIGLVTLRSVKEIDFNDRITKIQLQFSVVMPNSIITVDHIKFRWEMDRQFVVDYLQKNKSSLELILSSENSFFKTHKGNIQFFEFVKQNLSWDVKESQEFKHYRIDTPSLSIKLDEIGVFEVEYICISYTLHVLSERISLADMGNRIATLILQNLGSSGIFIWDDELSQFKIVKTDQNTKQVIENHSSDL